MILHELLTEAYREIADNISGLDRDFAEYAMNEVSLRWDPNDIDRAKKTFGNVDVGQVYRGMKIQSAEQLQVVSKLAEQGGTVTMHLESASPDWSTAASFANYVKSYDELTMMRELNTAIRNGSAGLFGTAILTLAPTPDQVIVKTYTTGDELDQNPTWRTPKQSAESEVILYGKIRCVAASIIPPLTKANWKETLLSTIKSVQQIEDWSLLDQWLDANRVPDAEINEVSRQLWASVIRTDKDLVDAMNCSRLNSAAYIERQPRLMKWLSTHIIRDNNRFYADLDGERIAIVKNTQLANRAWLKGSQTVDGTSVKNITIVERKLIDSLRRYTKQLGSPGVDWMNNLRKIDAEYSIAECMRFVNEHKRKLVNSAEINQMLTTIQASVDSQLKFMISFVSNVHTDPEPVIGGMSGFSFANQLRDLLSLAQEFPKLEGSRKQLINSIYNMVPGGAMDDKKRKLLDWWTQNIGYFLK